MKNMKTKSGSVEVKDITLNIKGKEIKLTIREAQDLQEALNQLFDGSTDVKIIERIVEIPYSPPPYVIWETQPKPHKYGEWEITCQDNSLSFNQS